jgi:hypothetical protein
LREIFAGTGVAERRQAAASADATRRMLMELAVDPDYLVRKAVVQNPQAPADALVLLYGAERDAICQIAFADDTPDFDPNRVLRLSSEEDLLSLAQHQNARSETLDRLTTSDFLPVRIAALRNPNISSEVLARVAQGRHPRLREIVAEVPNSPEAVLMRLADDDYEDVRLAVAANPRTTANILAKLAIDPSMRVRARAALHPGISADTLSRLTTDPVAYVRACVAANPGAPVATLTRLASDPEKETRLRVAEHDHTPASTLDQLANDSESEIRKAAASNPSTSVDTLKRLAYDREPEIQSCVFERPECELFNEEARRVLSRFAVDPQLLFEASPRRFCAAVIGSKHAAEIQFLFNDPTMESLTSISSLQSVFTKRNSGGEVLSVDRHRYLQFLTLMNDSSSHSGAFAIDAQSLRCVFGAFSHEEIITIAKSQRPEMARDSFRMIADLLGHASDQKCGPKLTMLRDWILRYGDYGPALHNYLSAHVSRSAEHRAFTTPFPQARLQGNAEWINRSLREEGVELLLPETAGDLLKLGQVMRHCCGSRYYVDACQDGRCIIFHLQPLGKPRQGTTFQFDFAGHLEQAKGFANRDPEPGCVEQGKMLYRQLAHV